jgi:hypothetical protein
MPRIGVYYDGDLLSIRIIACPYINQASIDDIVRIRAAACPYVMQCGI